jgi:ribosomal protein S18 acetylase RimI-like enzyme
MADPQVTLRTCAPADVPAVLALWRRADIDGSLPDTADALHRRLERDPELFVVAERDGRLVGTLVGGWDGWRGNLYRLAVEPAFRRRGIGRALVREVESRLRAKGARRITALVLVENTDGAGFWPAVGYGHDPAIRRHVRNL